jgi:spore germination protein GerM
MQKRLLNGAIVGITVLALLSACGQAKPPAGAAAGNQPIQSNGNQPSPAPAAPVQDNKQLKVKVYYGDEAGAKLVEQEATINIKQDSDKYSASLKALTQSDDSKQVPLLKGFTIKSAELANQLLTVDVSMAPESRLGAGGEDLLLQALKKTVFQFPEVQSLELLVEGNKLDSLMGHMELPHPIKRG